MFSLKRLLGVVLPALCLVGCIETTMQGYADRELPAKPVSRLVAYVAGPSLLASSLQSSISEEARKRGVVAQDALLLFPPTRAYTNAEVRQGLADNAVDGVLVINVGDTGVLQQCAGTILTGEYSGTPTANGTINGFGNTSTVSLSGVSSGTMTAAATPVYRYKRETAFTAQLLEPATSRKIPIRRRWPQILSVSTIYWCEEITLSPQKCSRSDKIGTTFVDRRAIISTGRQT
jgi:hypothetical protein